MSLLTTVQESTPSNFYFALAGSGGGGGVGPTGPAGSGSAAVTNGISTIAVDTTTQLTSFSYTAAAATNPTARIHQFYLNLSIGNSLVTTQQSLSLSPMVNGVAVNGARIVMYIPPGLTQNPITSEIFYLLLNPADVVTISATTQGNNVGLSSSSSYVVRF